MSGVQRRGPLGRVPRLRRVQHDQAERFSDLPATRFPWSLYESRPVTRTETAMHSGSGSSSMETPITTRG